MALDAAMNCGVGVERALPRQFSASVLQLFELSASDR